MLQSPCRNVWKPLVKAILIPAMILSAFAARPAAAKAGVVIDFDTYAAVAYSVKTGKYGYAWNYGSRGQAEREALSECTADDAEIVGWVKGGWLVLAIGDNKAYGVGWEYGDGATNTDAARRAIARCKEHGGKVTKIIYLCSGDIDPEVRE